MRITTSRRNVDFEGSRVGIARNNDGVLRLWADDDIGLAHGLGFAHAHDRLVQMILARLVGQGRICECLKSSQETLAIDVFMREMGLRREAEADVANLGADGSRLVLAYVDGVNRYLATHRRPLELLLVRHQPEPWTAADTLLTIKLMSYVGLAQSQQDMEKLLIQAVNGGASVEKLKSLVAPHLDGLDDSIVDLVRKVRLTQPLVSDSLRFLASVPTLMSSNNWAVAPSRSATGTALQCNDPHLECNRLPAIWYETIMHTADDYRIGATMPGVPGLVMGRTRRLSFGFTYGFMDMVDYFVEECRDGSCRRQHGFEALDVRVESILRKGSDPLKISIRESDLGVLETDPESDAPIDGFYLCRAWSAHRGGAAHSIDALAALPAVTTVPEAQKVVRNVAISCNWVLADRDGNIGFQQSGLLPDRGHSGLYPVPAWDEKYRWRGLVDADRLHSVLNPGDGFLASANDDHNPPGGPLVINLPMGSYRADRIRSLLSNCVPCTPKDMERIQNDLYSLQAERFMEIIRPMMPETFAGRILAGWDCRYDLDSRGATLFEAVYHALLREIFGRGMFGEEVWDYLVESTAIVADYYHLFDDAIFSEDPIWFPEGRDAVISNVLAEVLTEVDLTAIAPWGRCQEIEMKNIFFDGSLPSFFGFDHGPINLPGNRATVVQGGIFASHGRQTTFTPSWSFITDLGEDEAEPPLPAAHPAVDFRSGTRPTLRGGCRDDTKG